MMRWVGKAPRVVSLFTKRSLEDEIRATGFIDLIQPDVGAAADLAFVVATKAG
jgi:hypothetical protein